MLKLDHLVVVASTVEQGIDYFSKTFGLNATAGGKHIAMGTYNAVMKLDKDRYLEIIAIDPDGKTPDWPRWFNLDSIELQKEIKDKPRLITWVARTKNFEKLKEKIAFDIGTPKAMTRGDLSWRFGFTDDGSLKEDGMLPYIIQWDNDEHVSRRMLDNGYKLIGLELNHPNPNRIKARLSAMEFEGDIKINKSKTPFLKAYIKSANGIVEIS